ncbi:iron-containing alcohol dehydrogenase [Priestia koreensis]|uniref:iron-containing alcohol dehydrogenase n=1 Tax=Priestia koreensis TaxID=284581 RepID=UPI00203E2B5A|nr:iron-containing alcohol dehydrogenase [Priestia koreensis]MCM3004347.1 iron-containing alcohol dehydrogenase [Priestia koreensis]
MNTATLAFTPVNHTGWGSSQRLLSIVQEMAPASILVVTDPVLEEIGLVHKVIEPLLQANYHVEVYTDISPEPPLEVGENLVSFTRSKQVDLVIGIGGGSALDLAKLTAVLSVHEGKVEDYLNLTGKREITQKGVPKILIPTTSGTGSEVTNISVLSLESTKDVVTHSHLLADVAIVDPELTLSVPARVTAATGVDALTHAIEAYLSTQGNPVTDGLALHAIKLINRSLRTAVEDGNNRQARSDMSYGSYLAGLAFFNAGVGGVHALAYPLGGQFHLAHGESNAVLLPYVMDYIRSRATKRLADVLQAIEPEAVVQSEEEASSQCVQLLKQLVYDIGIPTTLREFQIPESAIEPLTNDATKQTRLLARSPMPLEKKDIQAIYTAAFYGE